MSWWTDDARVGGQFKNMVAGRLLLHTVTGVTPIGGRAAEAWNLFCASHFCIRISAIVQKKDYSI